MSLRIFDYVSILATIFFTVYGQLIIKWRVNHLSAVPDNYLEKLKYSFTLIFDPFIFSGMLAAFLASIAWISAISKFELSYAYPFVAMNFAFVILLSGLFLNEVITPYKILGVLLIMFGIFFTSRT